MQDCILLRLPDGFTYTEIHFFRRKVEMERHAFILDLVGEHCVNIFNRTEGYVEHKKFSILVHIAHDADAERLTDQFSHQSGVSVCCN